MRSKRLSEIKFAFYPHIPFFIILFLVLVLIGTGLMLLQHTQTIIALEEDISNSTTEKSDFEKNLYQTQKELKELKNQDQYKINQALTKEIENINKTYNLAVATYEKLIEINDSNEHTKEIEEGFARTLSFLAEKNYTSASAELETANNKIKTLEQEIASSFQIPQNVTSSNTPPSSGYQRQKVTLDIGTYLVDIVSADLNSTRVIVDTASDSDCRDNCPVFPLGEYVSRNGAFAGINGSYFCPSTYPSCAGKTNSFDTLLMNKNKTYFNSDNNVYSTVPVAVFGNGWARFIGRSLDWGRDTSIDGVIANQPLLISEGNIVYGGGGDPKLGSKGSRSFIGATDAIVYIGVVHNATVAEGALVLKALGLKNALNLDSGGSTALWAGGGYKAGPGRNIPNAILFVSR